MGVFAIGELGFSMWSSYCCVFCTDNTLNRTRWPQAEIQRSPGAFHHEEGAPTLLFLMVASEHSASEESQSESPN